MSKNKGIELSIRTIVILAIAIFTLIAIVLLFKGGFTEMGDKLGFWGKNVSSEGAETGGQFGSEVNTTRSFWCWHITNVDLSDADCNKECKKCCGKTTASCTPAGPIKKCKCT